MKAFRTKNGSSPKTEANPADGEQQAEAAFLRNGRKMAEITADFVNFKEARKGLLAEFAIFAIGCPSHTARSLSDCKRHTCICIFLKQQVS